MKNKEFSRLKRRFDKVTTIMDKLRFAIENFQAKLENLIEDYDSKMKEEQKANRKKRKNVPGMFKEPGQEKSKKRKSGGSGELVSITSKLWETVIVITNGIDQSVRSTDDVFDYLSISPKDYSLKNTFEIAHP